MQYRQDKYGNQQSVQGFDCLRFLQKNGKIDLEAAREQITLAVEQGPTTSPPPMSTSAPKRLRARSQSIWTIPARTS